MENIEELSWSELNKIFTENQIRIKDIDKQLDKIGNDLDRWMQSIRLLEDEASDLEQKITQSEKRRDSLEDESNDLGVRAWKLEEEIHYRKENGLIDWSYEELEERGQLVFWHW